jgi:hypothetical protein
VDYDDLNYVVSAPLVPFGKTYSPPLVSGLGVAPPWPERPGTDSRFARFQRVPPPLPPWSPAASARGRVAVWLRAPVDDGFRPPRGRKIPITAGRSLDEVAFF